MTIHKKKTTWQAAAHMHYIQTLFRPATFILNSNRYFYMTKNDCKCITLDLGKTCQQMHTICGIF